ncbi:MAG: DHHW family protein [Bacteroidota bacterium]
MPKSLQSVFLGLVGGILLIPAWGLWGGVERTDSCENRTLATYPEEQESVAFWKSFESYFKDHVWGRETVAQAASLLRVQVFQSSPRPDKAVIGKEGWLYYTSRSDKIFDSQARQNLLTEKELSDLFARWNRRKRILEERQIEYYQAVWPNKSTLYPDFLPARMKGIRRGPISKIDQVLAYAQKQESVLPILDVRESFIQKKEEARLYRKLDTHWNDLGAYYAYRELMSFLGEKAYSLHEFTMEKRETSEGDLMNMLGLCGLSTFSETIPELSYPEWDQIEKKKTGLSNMFVMLNPQAPVQKRLLIFRDSFTSALVPFISRHYSEVYFMWSDFREEVIWEVEPDVVIEAKVERYF